MTTPSAPPPADVDPALVAAGSPAAATLLGSSPLAQAAAGGGLASLTPTAGLPTVPPAPPVPASSRYATAGIGVYTGADGVPRPFLKRRLIPQPEDLATSGWERVAPEDRADLIAARALGDPTQFWQLCDANLAFDADELEQAGRLLRVALPAGFPATTSGTFGGRNG